MKARTPITSANAPPITPIKLSFLLGLIEITESGRPWHGESKSVSPSFEELLRARLFSSLFCTKRRHIPISAAPVAQPDRATDF